MTAPRSALATTALLLVAPLLVTAGMLPAASEPPGTAAAPTNGMIATFAWKPGAHISSPLDLVVMNADGSGAQVLVRAAATRSLCGFDLDWSPDGNRIAWASDSEVWTIDADGTDRTLVGDGCVSHVEWAPDGATLAVEIDSRAGLLTVATGAFEWLRPCAYGELGATFSPDGTRMAAVGTADCDQDPIGWGIYGFDVADGSLDARYADTNLRGQPPGMLNAIPSGSEWHPGQDTVLTSMGDSFAGGGCHPLGQTGSWSNADLYTVSATADATLTKVGSTSGEYEMSERDASWSPDGTRILFAGDRNVSCQSASYVRSATELWTMSANGTSATRIWTPWSVELGFVGSSWQPCTAATTTCVPVAPPVVDTDADGVPDADDGCPTVPGPVGNAGCPEDEPPPDPTDPTDPSDPTTPTTPTLPPPTTPTTPTTLPPAAAAPPSRMAAPRVKVRGRKVVVRWAAAVDNGSAVTQYVVDISRGRDKRAAPWARRVVFRGLEPGRHRFRVAATNGVGQSGYSPWTKVRVRR